MSEETLMILQMVQQGKLTPQQGEELLRAVQEGAPGAGPSASAAAGNSAPSQETLDQMQARLADLQSKLGEVQARLGAAHESSRQSRDQGAPQPSGPSEVGDFGIGGFVQDVMRSVSSAGAEAGRAAKIAVRLANRQMRQAFGVDSNWNLGRPENLTGLPEQSLATTLEADLSGGKQLRVVNPYGSVRVEGKIPASKAHVTLNVCAWGDERDELLGQLQASLEPAGDGAVILRVTGPEWAWCAVADLQIDVPGDCPVEVQTTFGDIHCRTLEAGLGKLDTASGNIVVDGMTGGAGDSEALLRSRSGDITLTRWMGAPVHAETMSGNVQARELRCRGLSCNRTAATWTCNRSW